MPSHALLLDIHIHIAVRTPKASLPSVWPLPRSLATTCGISVDFFSSPYLDVSVQAVPLIYLCIQYMMTVHYYRRIAPFRNLRIDAYLRLPVTYRSLSRLSSAPSAKAFALRPFSLDHQLEAGHVNECEREFTCSSAHFAQQSLRAPCLACFQARHTRPYSCFSLLFV